MPTEDTQLKVRHNEPHPQEARYEVARHIVRLGNIRLASELTNIPYGTILQWKKAEWWPAVMEEVKQEARAELQSKINTIAATSLDIMDDRLRNGEYILNNKTGELMRKPVGLRDANSAMNNLLTRSAEIEKLQATRSGDEVSANEILKNLAMEFAKLTRKKSTEVIDVVSKEI
jgi:hypothetical protein